MKLHNTLSRQLEDFKPLSNDGKTVTLYTCGPTVYNYYHIGNLRNAIFNDTLRRTLTASKYDVKHVMNITDVGHLLSDADEGEDKLETGAQREGKTVWEVAEHYTTAFKNDMAALNVLPPSVNPERDQNKAQHDSYARATDFIAEQIDMVKLLIDKGFAYQTEQAIYFEVSKLPDYGILSGQKLADKEQAARSEVVTDNDKRSPYDFALWFFTVGRYAGHTMHWPSPWGDGFPGWHLECSAIIHATLGDPIDIHTGGIDHIGTHHPNEMAQTEAAFGHQLANYWLHNDFMLVDGAKMAKSAGNSYTLKEITDKGFDPLAYRLLCLQAHYRSELNFSWESLSDATKLLENYRGLAALMWQPKEVKTHSSESFTNTVQEIVTHLANDLSTPLALAVLNGFSDVLKSTLVNKVDIASLKKFLVAIDGLFGLNLAEEPDITTEQKQLIAELDKARDAKDWETSDSARASLKQQGVSVNNTPYGTIWNRLLRPQPA